MSQPITDASRAGVHEASENVLYADHITIRFGGLVAVSDVSFGIPPKSIVSLIGPNGAGKTTFFNVLTGLYQASVGTVYLDGRDLHRTEARQARGTGHGPYLPEHSAVQPDDS